MDEENSSSSGLGAEGAGGPARTAGGRADVPQNASEGEAKGSAPAGYELVEPGNNGPDAGAADDGALEALKLDTGEGAKLPADEVKGGGGAPDGKGGRWILLLGVVAAGAVAHFAAGWLSVPAHEQFEGVLLHQPEALLSLGAAGFIYVVCAVLGTAIAGGARFTAGLFAAAAALVVISARSGSMQRALLWAVGHGGERQLFIDSAIELVALSAVVGASWLVVWRLRDAGKLRDRFGGERRRPRRGALGKGAAVLIQAGIVAGGVLLLAPTDAKQQVLMAVAVGSFFGTSFAENFFARSEPARLYWIGPMLVGAAGYLLAAHGESWVAVGHIHGMWGALARPLPMDYAAAGSAGAIMGLWAGAPVVRMFAEVLGFEEREA